MAMTSGLRLFRGIVRHHGVLWKLCHGATAKQVADTGVGFLVLIGLGHARQLHARDL